MKILTYLSLVFYFIGSEKSISFTSTTASGYHSGNLIVPIGSNKIHCEPPKEFEQHKGKSGKTNDIGYSFFYLHVMIFWCELWSYLYAKSSEIYWTGNII